MCFECSRTRAPHRSRGLRTRARPLDRKIGHRPDIRAAGRSVLNGTLYLNLDFSLSAFESWNLTMPLQPTWEDIALRLVSHGARRCCDRPKPRSPWSCGFRTTILVGLAASASMIQANLLLSVGGKTPDSFGFIGGGAILKRGDLVLGVTTAATLWIMIVIGLCFGGGRPWNRNHSPRLCCALGIETAAFGRPPRTPCQTRDRQRFKICRSSRSQPVDREGGLPRVPSRTDFQL
jgi:hypothetical protein